MGGVTWIPTLFGDCSLGGLCQGQVLSGLWQTKEVDCMAQRSARPNTVIQLDRTGEKTLKEMDDLPWGSVPCNFPFS
jgi:hypothetical protein